MKPQLLRLLSTVICLMLFPLLARGAAPLEWESAQPQHRPNVKSLVPTLGGKEAYSERYDFRARLEGGGRLRMAWTISNLGWGDGRGAAQVELQLPGAEPYDFGKKVGRDKWSFGENPFQLKIAGTTLRATGNDTFKLTHEGKVRVEVTFRNRMPMWSPGRLTCKKGYRHVILISPRADVEGRIRVNGRWRKVRSDGAGYADHTATNLPPHKMAVNFSRFHAYRDDVTIIWKSIDLTKKFGGKRIAWIMVGEGNEVAFHDLNANLTFEDHRKDVKTGYRIPRRIRTTARSEEDRIQLVQRAEDYTRTDLLAKYGTFAQLIAGAVSTPFRFEQDAHFTCETTINAQTSEFEGTGELVMDYLHK